MRDWKLLIAAFAAQWIRKVISVGYAMGQLAIFRAACNYTLLLELLSLS